MKYIRQLMWILLVSFIGEVLRFVIPLPIPASIYGLVLMVLALKTKIIKLESVRDTGKYLIDIMPLAFIPACVGIMTAWDKLKPVAIPVVVISVISTVLVMGVTGSVTQFVIRRKECKADEQS